MINVTKIQKIITLSFIFYFLFFIFNISFTYGKAIDLYFFWGSGCPHGAKMARVLKEISGQYPELKIKAFEVWYNPNNQRLLTAMAEGYNFKPQGVPVIFVGDWVIEGDGQVEINQLKEAVRICSITGCASPIEKVRVSENENKIRLNWKNIGITAGVIIFIIFLISLLRKKKTSGD